MSDTKARYTSGGNVIYVLPTPYDMDAPDGPHCGCGKPSVREDGSCGLCHGHGCSTPVSANRRFCEICEYERD